MAHALHACSTVTIMGTTHCVAVTGVSASRDHVYQMAAAAVLNPVKEGRFLLPGTDRRPADVFISNWAAGFDAALDM